MGTRNDFPREHEDDLQWPVPSEVLDRYEHPGDQGGASAARPKKLRESQPRSPEAGAPPSRNGPERPRHADEAAFRSPTARAPSTAAPQSVRAARASDAPPALRRKREASALDWDADPAIIRTPPGSPPVGEDPSDVEPGRLFSAAAACAVIALAFAVTATVLPDFGPLLRGETTLFVRSDAGLGADETPVPAPSPVVPPEAAAPVFSTDPSGTAPDIREPAPDAGSRAEETSGPSSPEAAPPDTPGAAGIRDEPPPMPTSPPASQRLGTASSDAAANGEDAGASTAATPRASRAASPREVPPVMPSTPPASQQPRVASSEAAGDRHVGRADVSDPAPEIPSSVRSATPSTSGNPGTTSNAAVAGEPDGAVTLDDESGVAPPEPDRDAAVTVETPAVPEAEAPEPAAPEAAAPSTAPAPPPDRARIDEVLGRYRAAYESLDAGAAQAVWPTVDAGALTRAFGNLSSQSLAFDQCDVAVNGDEAQASCSGRATYVPRVGGSDPRTVWLVWTFTLRRSASEWTIADVETR